jgi:hypothetical protein
MKDAGGDVGRIKMMKSSNLLYLWRGNTSSSFDFSPNFACHQICEESRERFRESRPSPAFADLCDRSESGPPSPPSMDVYH